MQAVHGSSEKGFPDSEHSADSAVKAWCSWGAAAASAGAPDRTTDTTSPGSRASPGSLPHLPLRYTFRGCGTERFQARSMSVQTTLGRVGCRNKTASHA
jgi:hypothetical protein